jgi:hypothetical protein
MVDVFLAVMLQSRWSIIGIYEERISLQLPVNASA